MTGSEDDVDRRLRDLRPDTGADDGWAASTAGDAALARIRAELDATAENVAPPSLRRLARRPAVALTGLAAAVAAVLALAVTVPGTDPNTDPAVPGTTPAEMALVSFDDCRSALADLRQAATAHQDTYRSVRNVGVPLAAGPLRAESAPMAGAADSSAKTPAVSGTNNQEADVDEPDVVKTDGRRLVSITRGVLRVTDVATRQVTGTLDLSMYAGADRAQLLLDGDRALVLLAGDTRYYLPSAAPNATIPDATTSRPTYLLVDLGGARPKVLSTFRPRGAFVDARFVDGVVRLVVSSTPDIRVPHHDDAVWRRQIARTPIDAWLPSWTVTSPGGATTSHAVPCRNVAHPRSFTGARMVTVYSIDPARGFADVRPVSIAADGSSVYGSGKNLYVTELAGRTTHIHRFGIAGHTRPRYAGSGTVPGSVRDSYSLSEYDGTLRVVTTTYGRGGSESAVYTLNATTLRERGHVSGVGRGEQTYGIRFAGPYGYVVTFRQMDPLHVIDLSDPAAPRLAGELKLPGYSAYLHVVGDGRLLGTGPGSGGWGSLQASLFDVSDPASPSRLDEVSRARQDTNYTADPHTFLYWAPTRTAFLLTRSFVDGVTRVVVVRVGEDGLTEAGTITNPARGGPVQGADGGITRALVVGDQVWTVSASGVLLSSLDTLDRQAWIGFSAP